MNSVIEKIKNDTIINLIRKYSSEGEIYLVGGTVRDFYLGVENFDKDIIVDKTDAKEYAIKLAEYLEAVFVPLDEEYGIYRLILPDKINYIDIANPIGKNIEEDLSRRDLTINAIAVNLNTFEILDLFNGMNDLKSRKIRHISEQNFVDDPLRLLRVYRFQANLGFDVDDELIKIISKYSTKILNSAIERVNYELLKLFSGKFSSETLLCMNKTGLLKEILPISEDLKEVPPNPHHHLNLFFHSIEVVKQIQIIYEKSIPEVQNHLDTIDFGGNTRFAHLKFAGFLHDIGKPGTWTIEPDTGKHRFIKHDDLGSKMAVNILKKMKLSKKQIEYIVKMIKYHIYPSHVVSNPEVNEKSYLRFVRKMDADAIDVIILAMADRFSAMGPEITEEIVNKNISNLQTLLDFYLEIKDKLQPLPKLLSGNEIMEILQLSPSPELGFIVKALLEAQLSGEVNTKDEAIKFIKSMGVSSF